MRIVGNARAAVVAALLSSGLLLGACGDDNPAARMARASNYLEHGEHRSAAIELKNVLQSQPENAQAWFTLGRVSLASGQYADAAHQFRRARDYGMAQQQGDKLLAQALIGEGSFKKALGVLHPDAAGDSRTRAELHSLRGRAYLGLDDEKQARQAFAAALAAQPEYPAALVGQAQLAWLGHDGARAQKLLERATQVDPAYGTAWAVAGALAFAQGRCDDTIDIFGHIQALDANALPPAQVFHARAQAAQCQLQQGQLEQAAANIDVLMTVGPEHPTSNTLKALLAYENKHYDQATTHVQKALAASPHNASGLVLLGSIKAAQGDLQAAQFHFTEAVTQSPDNLAARQLLASIYIRRDLPEQAIAVLQEALDAHGSEPRFLAQLADASLRAGQQDQGLQYLKRSAQYAGGKPELQLALARGMAQAGDADDALALLERTQLEDGGAALKAKALKIALHLKNGEAEKAIFQAQGLAQDNPDDIRLVRLLARVYVAADQITEARATLEKALKANPDNANLRLDLGWLAVRDGDYDSANKIFQTVLDTHPDDLRAVLAMAQSAAKQGQPALATDWLKKAAELRPENLALHEALMRAYVAQGRHADALALAEALVTRAPDDARAHWLQSMALSATGDEDGALAGLEKAVALAPDALAIRLELARLLVAQQRLDAAARQLQQIREQDPDSVPAAVMLAKIRLGQDRVQDALAIADNLRNDEKNAASAYALTGELMRAQEQYEAAAEAYAQAHNIRPTRGLALRLFDVRRLGQLPHPEQSLLDWLRQHPDDVAVMAALAQWHQAAGASGAATEQYRALLAKDPNNALALNNLAVIYFENGDARALALAEQAYKAAPQSPAIADTLGWILINDGNLQRGLALLRQAAQGAPAQPEIQYHLAAALTLSGQTADRAEARSILTGVLASNPSFQGRSDAEILLEKFAK